MSGANELILARQHWEAMRVHVSAEAPLEACGLVAGAGGESTHIFPIENELKSPLRYRLAPKQQLAAFMEMEERGWEMLAIYHSHPAGPPTPSRTDLAEAYYPEPVQLIWSPVGGEWACHAFLFKDGGAVEVHLRIAGHE